MKISLSMAFDKKKAEQVIVNQFEPVSEHIAKIWVHTPSNLDHKWEVDISIFMGKIVRYANNIDTPKGHVGERWLTTTLNDSIINLIDDCAIIFASDQYAKLPKKLDSVSKVKESVEDYLIPKLHSQVNLIVKLILSNTKGIENQIAGVLASHTIEARDAIQ